jgi:hypothetical protein
MVRERSWFGWGSAARQAVKEEPGGCYLSDLDKLDPEKLAIYLGPAVAGREPVPKDLLEGASDPLECAGPEAQDSVELSVEDSMDTAPEETEGGILEVAPGEEGLQDTVLEAVSSRDNLEAVSTKDLLEADISRDPQEAVRSRDPLEAESSRDPLEDQMDPTLSPKDPLEAPPSPRDPLDLSDVPCGPYREEDCESGRGPSLPMSPHTRPRYQSSELEGEEDLPGLAAKYFPDLAAR